MHTALGSSPFSDDLVNTGESGGKGPVINYGEGRGRELHNYRNIVGPNLFAPSPLRQGKISVTPL